MKPRWRASWRSRRAAHIAAIVAAACGILACGTLLNIDAEATNSDSGSGDSQIDTLTSPALDDGGSDGDAPNDGPTTWCSTQTVQFCVDFDRPNEMVSLPAIFSSGTIGLVTGNVRSMPRALLSTAIAAVDSQGTSGWSLASFPSTNVKLAFAFKVDELVTGGGATTFADFSFGKYLIQIRLTASSVVVEWYDTMANVAVNGQGSLGPWNPSSWNDVVLEVKADGIHDSTGALVLGPLPGALSNAGAVILGIIYNPTGAAAKIRYDNLTVAH